MAINFNAAPYHDDFDALKNYIRVLFRPGFAVQARELTQLQSALQNQITNFGDHVFEDGSMVIPGGVTLDTKTNFIKTNGIFPQNNSGTLGGTEISSTNYVNYEGLIIKSDTSNLEAKIIKIEPYVDASNPVTFYVRYLNSGDNGEKVFSNNEILNIVYNNVGSEVYTQTQTTNSTGYGSIFSINDGIYYVNQAFITVPSTRLTVDRYNANIDTINLEIGLNIEENIITTEQDATLTDNAQGTYNYAAPGAHRYQIKPVLVTQDPDNTTYDNFVLLMKLLAGKIVKKVRTTDYAFLEDNLAKRTFDESGDYTINPFIIATREHLRSADGSNGGLYLAADGGDDTKFIIGVEPSSAYVKGYQVETLSTTNVPVNKARTTSTANALSISTNYGNYFQIDATTVEGNPNYELPDLSALPPVEFKNSSNNTIGTANLRAVTKVGSYYRFYVFNVSFGANSPTLVDNISVSVGPTAAITNLSLNNSAGLQLYESNRNGLLFEYAFDQVDTINDLEYVVGYFQSATISGNSTTIQADSSSDLIIGPEVISTDTTGFTSTYTISTYPAGEGLGLDISGLTPSTGTLDIFVKALRSAQTKKALQLNANTSVTLNTPNENSSSGIFYLGKNNVIDLKAVYHTTDGSIPSSTNGDDVTQYFTLDKNITDNFYGISRAIKSSTFSLVSNSKLTFVFDQLAINPVGDFLCVDSYTSAGYAIEDIPYYISTSLKKEVSLSNVIDFRPSAIEFNADTQYHNSGASTFVSNPLQFAIATEIPYPTGSYTSADVDYYLGRVDKLYIDTEGEISTITGIPDSDPVAPADRKDGMTLYEIYVPPYTRSVNDVITSFKENRRYTMRDINLIDTRVKNLEYYTVLSLLERDTASKDVFDGDGQPAEFKNGFVVDNFSNTVLANALSNEYRASIDKKEGTLRNIFNEENIPMRIDSASSSNYAESSGLYSLSYTETESIKQGFASNWINVNPYDVFSWIGGIELSPDSDEWKDTENRPSVTINQDGVYDAMVSILNETDAIGTVWNEWETQWTGKKTKSQKKIVDQVREGDKVTTTFEATTSWQEKQTTTGIKTELSETTLTTNLGERVVDTNFAPFIRSRRVGFKATRLKPNTQVYAFLDDINVTDYVKTTTNFIEYGDRTDAGIDVRGQNTFTYHPELSATPTLTTNANGELIGEVFIPNNETLKFKTGTRVFSLSDSPNNNFSDITTQASTNYIAKGLIQTKENVSISTRVPKLNKSEVTDERIVTKTGTETTQSVSWVDPLAQSFLITSPGGEFITSIEIYFRSKDDNIPVTLQIREMQNGIPTPRIIPFSEVVKNASDVNIASWDSSGNLSNATKFTFQAPVYLQNNVEYCFVLLANSNKYEVLYSIIGENRIGTSTRISKQPYNGVLFKSQNASTWTPDQNADLAFKINKAQFATSGTLVFKNIPLSDRILDINPFEITASSNVVKIHHRNHGFCTNGDEVQFVDSHTFNNITLTAGTDYPVNNITPDSYTITASTNANATGLTGGSGVKVKDQILYNIIHPIIQELNTNSTDTNWAIDLITGTSFSGNETPYQNAGTFNFTPNENYYVKKTSNNGVQLIPGSIVFDTTKLQTGVDYSIKLTCTMTTNDANRSPVIDINRLSCALIRNRVNNHPNMRPYTDNNESIINSSNIELTGDYSDIASLSKYITKNVELATPASNLKIFLDVNIPYSYTRETSDTGIDLYYKIASGGEDIDSKNWIFLPPTNDVEKTSSSIYYTEAEYDVLSSTGSTISFQVFAVKIVLRSNNSSVVPSCKNFRAIAFS